MKSLSSSPFDPSNHDVEKTLQENKATFFFKLVSIGLQIIVAPHNLISITIGAGVGKNQYVLS